MPQLRLAFDRVTNLVVFAMCLSLGASILFRLFQARVDGNVLPPGLRESTYQVGELLPPIDLAFADSGPTVLLVVKSTCRFCELSMPFYDRLLKAAELQQVPVIALSTEAANLIQAYFERYHVRIRAIQTVSEGDLRAPATPTLLLADSRRAVTNVWIGQLTHEEETEVLVAIQRSVQRSGHEEGDNHSKDRARSRTLVRGFGTGRGASSASLLSGVLALDSVRPRLLPGR